MARKSNNPSGNKKLTKEEQIRILEVSNEMLEKTKRETLEHKDSEESIELINQAINENYAQMIAIDPSLAEKINTLKLNELKDNREYLKKYHMHVNETPSIDFSDSKKEKDMMVRMDNNNKNDIDSILSDNSSKLKESITGRQVVMENDTNIDKEVNEKANNVPQNDYYFDVRDKNLSYDVIPLPSNGEVYREKIPKLSVAYLTAESENLITSPHLYKDDLIIDALLKYHVQNKGFNTDNLISGDVDAIMLWLRATGYGNEYPIVVTDPKTGKDFEAVVDLTKIKIKDFKLKGDANGWFDFTLPMSGVPVKFKYLSRKEEKQLQLYNKIEGEESRKSMVKQDFNSLMQCLTADEHLNETTKDKIKTYLDSINELWIKGDGGDSENRVKINHMITNRLEMSIMSINGKIDREYIRQFIRIMPALDSLKLRRYIEDNRPGVDWNTTVERPASLGGGSVNIFLEWGTDAFLNVI